MISSSFFCIYIFPCQQQHKQLLFLHIVCVECSLLFHAFVICAASAAHQKLNRADGFPVRDSDGLVIIGLSVCWEARDAYYISLQKEQSKGTDAHILAQAQKNIVKNLSLIQPAC